MSSRQVPKIYTDGSCLKNPGGASGWSFCLPGDDKTWVISGGVESSTNNRMELTAVIEALKSVPDAEYEIYTDSLLTLKCAQGLWKRKANLDLWDDYSKVSRGKKLHWHWVKGHSGDKFNEMVDKAARDEAKLQKNKNLAQ